MSLGFCNPGSVRPRHFQITESIFTKMSPSFRNKTDSTYLIQNVSSVFDKNRFFKGKIMHPEKPITTSLTTLKTMKFPPFRQDSDIESSVFTVSCINI